MLQYAMAVQLTSRAQDSSQDIPKMPVRHGLVVHNPNGWVTYHASTPPL